MADGAVEVAGAAGSPAGAPGEWRGAGELWVPSPLAEGWRAGPDGGWQRGFGV